MIKSTRWECSWCGAVQHGSKPTHGCLTCARWAEKQRRNLKTTEWVPLFAREDLVSSVALMVGVFGDGGPQKVAEAIVEKLTREETVAESTACVDCGEVDARFAPCPYAQEIHGNDGDVWLCDECRHERAQDI